MQTKTSLGTHEAVVVSLHVWQMHVSVKVPM
jgi:hypothetical protein